MPLVCFKVFDMIGGTNELAKNLKSNVDLFRRKMAAAGFEIMARLSEAQANKWYKSKTCFEGLAVNSNLSGYNRRRGARFKACRRAA